MRSLSQPGWVSQEFQAARPVPSLEDWLSGELFDDADSQLHPSHPHPSSSTPTITHDSAPLPQAIVPETRFAAYERDSHAEAFAWAAAEMARKYPGAVGTLESLQGLMNQYLAARGLRRPNQQ